MLVWARWCCRVHQYVVITCLLISFCAAWLWRASRNCPCHFVTLNFFWQKVAEERIHSYKKWQCEFILRALPVANGRDGDSQWILFARIELWSCLSIQDSGSTAWSLVVEFESP